MLSAELVAPRSLLTGVTYRVRSVAYVCTLSLSLSPGRHRRALGVGFCEALMTLPLPSLGPLCSPLSFSWRVLVKNPRNCPDNRKNL